MKARKTIVLKRMGREGQVGRLVSALEPGRRGKGRNARDMWPKQFSAQGKVPPP